ncbi:MAG: ABC transporter ATP-binding protein [Desulfobacterales bacterium]
MLSVEDIHTYYGHIHALKGISLEVKEKEIVCLIGSNGAGKSTTLMTVNGILHPAEGRILFLGQDITTLPADKIAGLGITQVPEGVYELFPLLAKRRKQQGGTLSGGEQQMLAIGRALMSKPKLLLLDEPSLGLAPLIVEKIFDIIRQINESGTTIFLVEQNANMALSISGNAYVMESGLITLKGAAKDLAKDEAIRKAYLGED